jgi:hypothetical protein
MQCGPQLPVFEYFMQNLSAGRHASVIPPINFIQQPLWERRHSEKAKIANNIMVHLFA